MALIYLQVENKMEVPGIRTAYVNQHRMRIANDKSSGVLITLDLWYYFNNIGGCK